MTGNLDALKLAHKKNAEMKAAGIKVIRLNPMEKLKTNPTNRKLAINAMCYDCQGRDADPKNKDRIRDCQSTDCPLWHVRPYRG